MLVRLLRLFQYEEPEPGGTSIPPGGASPTPEPETLHGVNERLDRLENKIEAALSALAKPIETPPVNPDVDIPPPPAEKKVRRGLRKVVKR